MGYWTDELRRCELDHETDEGGVEQLIYSSILKFVEDNSASLPDLLAHDFEGVRLDRAISDWMDSRAAAVAK